MNLLKQSWLKALKTQEPNLKNMKSFLSDDIVMLRPLNKQDIEGNYGDWFNDPIVVRGNSHGRFPMTHEKLEKYVIDSELNSTLLVLAVVLKENDAHVGNISLQNISWIDRSSEIAFVLGDAGCHGKGIMFRAGNLLIRHAFNELNLRRIYCGTLSTNMGMIRLAAKLNMQEEGRRREAIYKNGSYIDIIEFGILK